MEEGKTDGESPELSPRWGSLSFQFWHPPGGFGSIGSKVTSMPMHQACDLLVAGGGLSGLSARRIEMRLTNGCGGGVIMNSKTSEELASLMESYYRAACGWAMPRASKSWKQSSTTGSSKKNTPQKRANVARLCIYASQ
jgi:hypothetical protein